MKPIEYYIHIPFCVRKCAYCDFLSFAADRDIRSSYLSQLCEEIRHFDENQEYEISTIFIGGGTPSILTVSELEQLLTVIHSSHRIQSEAEITLESNPGTLNQEKLDCMVSHGVNRLSMGVQSFNDDELCLLGRVHTSDDVYRSFELARRAGLSNVNLDLMSALPGQSVSAFLFNLKKAVALKPEHISAYSLIIEEGTPFYERYRDDEERKERGEVPRFLPSEEDERDIYYQTGDFLYANGYEHYEISNYAKPGKECRHNIGYWERAEYKGFGLGAASLINHTRLSNTISLSDYLYGETICSKEPLSQTEQMEETMFLGLRLIKGVSKVQFFKEFNKDITDVYPNVIEELINQNLLVDTGNYIRLSNKGIDLANYVMAKFLK